MGFGAIDYLILIGYLLATAAFGTWLGRGQKDTRDYFLGGRKLPWWAICFSIVATETSTLTFIGAPAIAYTGDLTFLQVAMGYIVGKTLVSFFLIPAYFKGEIETAYELLQHRFGSLARALTAVIYQITRALADGVRLYSTGLVLAVVIHISEIWAVVIIGVITVFYTFAGGIRAVVWNDVIQLFVYLGGALVVFFVLLDKLPGGWEAVAASAAAADKFRVFNFSFDWSVPYTFFAGLVGGGFLTFATHGTDQMMVQRYLASGSRGSSQLALIVSGFLVLIQWLFFLIIGVMLFAFYQEFPLGRELEQADRILPIFIVEQLPSGVSGLIIAAVFAAAMSSLSSSLNALASSTVNDFYKSYVRGKSEAHFLNASRLFTLLWGVMLILIAVQARATTSVLELGLAITSVTMGLILGIFLLGQWSMKTGQTACLVGAGFGLIAVLSVVGSPDVAWTWYVLTGTTVTFIVGKLATLFQAGQRSRRG